VSNKGYGGLAKQCERIGLELHGHVNGVLQGGTRVEVKQQRRETERGHARGEQGRHDHQNECYVLLPVGAVALPATKISPT
jgi:hypothetical protein